MKHTKSILLATWFILLSGCIDGQEEVFIKEDGSASVKAVYRIPGVFFSAGDAEELRADIAREVGMGEHLMLVTNQVHKEEGNRVITLVVETANLKALEGLLSEHTLPKQASKADKVLHAIVGRISVDVEGLRARFSRKIDVLPLLNEYMGEDSLAMLGDSEFRYTIHLPKAIEHTNAHEVLNDGRTLKWVHHIGQAKGEPITMMMVASVPLPSWVIVSAIILAAALLLVAIVLGRRLGRGKPHYGK